MAEQRERFSPSNELALATDVIGSHIHGALAYAVLATEGPKSLLEVNDYLTRAQGEQPAWELTSQSRQIGHYLDRFQAAGLVAVQPGAEPAGIHSKFETVAQAKLAGVIAAHAVLHYALRYGHSPAAIIGGISGYAVRRLRVIDGVLREGGVTSEDRMVGNALVRRGVLQKPGRGQLRVRNVAEAEYLLGLYSKEDEMRRDVALRGISRILKSEQSMRMLMRITRDEIDQGPHRRVEIVDMLPRAARLTAPEMPKVPSAVSEGLDAIGAHWVKAWAVAILGAEPYKFRAGTVRGFLPRQFLEGTSASQMNNLLRRLVNHGHLLCGEAEGHAVYGVNPERAEGLLVAAGFVLRAHDRYDLNMIGEDPSGLSLRRLLGGISGEGKLTRRLQLLRTIQANTCPYEDCVQPGTIAPSLMGTLRSTLTRMEGDGVLVPHRCRRRWTPARRTIAEPYRALAEDLLADWRDLERPEKQLEARQYALNSARRRTRSTD